MKILIVEDEKLLARHLGLLIENFGTCLAVNSGEEALKAFGSALSEDPFDIIFLDLNLPDFTGHQLLIAIRAIELGLPRSKRARVFMCTASADPEDVKKAYREKCDGYLIKPVDMQQLEEKLSAFGIHPQKA